MGQNRSFAYVYGYLSNPTRKNFLPIYIMYVWVGWGGGGVPIYCSTHIYTHNI